MRLKRENPEAVVALLATDRNMRIVAGGYGVESMELNGIRLGSFRAARVEHETKTPARVFAVIATGAVLFLYGINAPHAQHIGEHLIGDWCEGGWTSCSIFWFSLLGTL